MRYFTSNPPPSKALIAIVLFLVIYGIGSLVHDIIHFLTGFHI
jgi:hypothetical protein